MFPLTSKVSGKMIRSSATVLFFSLSYLAGMQRNGPATHCALPHFLEISCFASLAVPSRSSIRLPIIIRGISSSTLSNKMTKIFSMIFMENDNLEPLPDFTAGLA